MIAALTDALNTLEQRVSALENPNQLKMKLKDTSNESTQQTPTQILSERIKKLGNRIYTLECSTESNEPEEENTNDDSTTQTRPIQILREIIAELVERVNVLEGKDDDDDDEPVEPDEPDEPDEPTVPDDIPADSTFTFTYSSTNHTLSVCASDPVPKPYYRMSLWYKVYNSTTYSTYTATVPFANTPTTNTVVWTAPDEASDIKFELRIYSNWDGKGNEYGYDQAYFTGDKTVVIKATDWTFIKNVEDDSCNHTSIDIEWRKQGYENPDGTTLERANICVQSEFPQYKYYKLNIYCAGSSVNENTSWAEIQTSYTLAWTASSELSGDVNITA